MTKKKKTALLIIVVVLIYGAVVFRFFMLSDDDSSQALLSQPMQAFTPEKVAETAQFAITNDYRDPFLGTLPSRSRTASSNASRQQIAKKDAIVFPSISYKGLVSDAGNGKRIFAIEIEGKEFVVAQGKVIQEIQVLTGDKNGITVSYKGSKKTYTKLL